MSREVELTKKILEEALRRWRRGTVKDELAPSLTVCLLGQESDPQWYVSLVRYVKRNVKRVERSATSPTLAESLTKVAAGFLPPNQDYEVDELADKLEALRQQATKKPPRVRKDPPTAESNAAAAWGSGEWCGDRCGGAVCDVCG